MIDAGLITSARVTHATGSVDDIAAANPESQRVGVCTLRAEPAVEEAYVLATCNRVEAYVVTDHGDDGAAALDSFFAPVDEESVVRAGHEASLRHLLRVAAGLESVVLGEDQVLGQIRTAYEDARHADGIGSLLEHAVTKAIRVGERARTETKINEGIVSLGSAATCLAARERRLAGTTALVVGAGEMGRLAARSLADAGVGTLLVANRTVPHAKGVVDDVAVSGEGVGLDALERIAPSAEVIVAATGSQEPVLGPEHLDEGEAVIVDLGQPRDVDPSVGSLERVTIFDLDDLESVTEETRERRAAAAAAVESLVANEFEHLCEQYKRGRADEVIGAMYESASTLKRRELDVALSRLDLDEEQARVVEAMADSLVNKLLAPPTSSLREAAADDDWETIATALQLFDPAFEEGEGPEAVEAWVRDGAPSA